MQAKETKLQDIIEGTKQYVVPLFQRGYSWKKEEWETLWEDLLELAESEGERGHFIGSIVTMPALSVPEGVSKYLLIDGQQRLTTIFIILALLRDKAREEGHTEFSEEITNTLLVNPYKKNLDHYKILPTQADREAYEELIHSSARNEDGRLSEAYAYFEKKLKQSTIDPVELKKVITHHLSVVSIVLDRNDNPYMVFESLNAKGRPLTQADLIRNYLIMCIHTDQQEEKYHKFWKPMEESLQENLTEYIRHYLMRENPTIKKNEVYFSLKSKVSPQNASEYLKELSEYAHHYMKLLNPEQEADNELRKYIERLNIIEVTTAYPLLLDLYHDFHNKKLIREDFIEILKTLENYLIRRFICNLPSHQLNKVFPTLYRQAFSRDSADFVSEVKEYLSTKYYPKDSEFIARFKEVKLYGSRERAQKAKLILQALEESFGHKEEVSFKSLTIEHLMPQTLSEWWQKNLGEEWEETYELFRDTIGNLTLTAYNTELSNDTFPTKRELLAKSHLELNHYFNDTVKWDREEIEKRSEVLSNLALEVWPYFGEDSSGPEEIIEVTGKTPGKLWILNQSFEVKSWRDVLEHTMNTICDLEPEKFEIIMQNFPGLAGRDKSRFRAIRELKNGVFIETNLSARKIYNFCTQSIEIIDLTSEDWKVEFVEENAPIHTVCEV